MKILLTNDDGINAEGIQSLRSALCDNFTNVNIVAPDREKSASGHGITVHKPLRANRINYSDSCIGYSINGTPADCIKLAIQELLQEKPDIIISGINSGANLGTDILYSGTVSAAIEGTISQIPSIAISLVLNGDSNYSTAAKFINNILPKLKANKLPKNTMLNINVPDLPYNEIKDVKITKLGIRKYENCIEKRQDPRGKTYYWLGGEAKDLYDENDYITTDAKAVFNSCISVSPVHFDLTNYSFLDELKEISNLWNL